MRLRKGSEFDRGWFQNKRWKTTEKRCVKIQRGEGKPEKGLLLGHQHGEAERKELCY